MRKPVFSHAMKDFNFYTLKGVPLPGGMIDISNANLNVLFMNTWQGKMKRSHEGLGVFY